MRFWEINGEVYDVVIADNATAAADMVRRYHGNSNLDIDTPRREMTRAELDACRVSIPLTIDHWNEADRIDETRTIGSYLDEMDAAEAERKRVADFEARQVPLFK